MYSNDTHHMKTALSLANRGIGRTAPNPSVGCIIVKNNIVIARGHTADGGRPHAETIALNKAGAQANGTTLYVTLEPCTHHGQTPPCIEAIIKSGVTRVVIGAKDVDPRVAGKSIQRLKNAGIEVVAGILEDECNDLNAGFINKITKNRPYITIKTACTLDGKTALASGESKWITGDIARRHVHLVRSRHDAILVGVGTVTADNPTLTTRVNGLEHNPVRVVLDSNLRIPIDSTLVKTADKTPVWVFYIDDDENNKKELEQSGVKLFKVKDKKLSVIMERIATEGITRLLVEGGQNVHACFIRENLCDKLLIYRASKIFGDTTKSAFADLSIGTLANAYNFKKISTQALGLDTLEVYKCLQG